MKFVFSILTAVWAGFATPSPLPAEDHTESSMRVPVKERTPHQPLGLALVSPYVRGKTPVLFVHGLWARPSSWRPMIGALAADPVVDARFQFWTFGYSTGNPIPYSAYLLGRDLD